MSQNDLFSWTPPAAANTDPATSHEAAQRHTASGQRQANARLVLELVRRQPGSTSVELWRAAGDAVDRVEVSRRLADLMRLGLVTQGKARPCHVKGTSMVTWWSVENNGVPKEN